MRIVKTVIAFAAAASLLAHAAAAQSAWSYPVPQRWARALPASSPAPRDAHRMATDLATHHVVMFGGWNGSAYLGDTWEYDGVTWTQNVLPGPRARALHALAYDEARGVTLLFGGVFAPGQSGYLGDTWQYANGAWTQLSSAAFPPRRFDHGMVYDGKRSRIVMFGGRGSSGSSLMGDTWEWDGSSWTRALPAVSPTPRAGHAMAFDPIFGRVILFGGIQLGGPIVGDMWSWDGANWTQIFPAHEPSARWHAVMATDLGSGHVVLYGGNDGTDLMDTWTWDGTDWTRMRTRAQPQVPALPAMTTGPGGSHIVLFGGEDANGTLRDHTWWFGKLPRHGN
jgi:hypothetical protein